MSVKDSSFRHSVWSMLSNGLMDERVERKVEEINFYDLLPFFELASGAEESFYLCRQKHAWFSPFFRYATSKISPTAGFRGAQFFLKAKTKGSPRVFLRL